uniref:Phosphate transporter n=1 Tax=Acrobeloides nanus TaxID=290746 RepID=A0A914CEI7_9BILA
MDSTTISIFSSTLMTGLETFQSNFLWALIIGFILAFAFGFGMGGNDVANAFGTSVGSKVLTIRNAYILATIVETLGAILVGYNVTDTMRKSVVDVAIYQDKPEALFLGQLAILGGSSIWLLIATFSHLPVSATHSSVGATIGFSLLIKGTQGINWWMVLRIVGSWFLSPVLSGFISAILYMIVDFAVLRRKHPLKCGLRLLPIFLFFCIAFNAFAVSYQGSKILGLSSVPLWLALAISLALGLLAGLVMQFVAIPRLEAWVKKGGENNEKVAEIPMNLNVITVGTLSQLNVQDEKQLPIGMTSKHAQPKFHPSVKGFLKWFLPAKHRQEDSETLRLFSSLQVFTACFAGFAHGANDVSNAIAPVVALMAIYKDLDVMQPAPTPIWLLFFGTASVCIGLWCLGDKVIRTVGTKMSEINPCSGFTIEFGAGMTAILASKAENQRHQILKQADKELWNNFSTFIAFGIGIEIVGYGLKHLFGFDSILT